MRPSSFTNPSALPLSYLDRVTPLSAEEVNVLSTFAWRVTPMAVLIYIYVYKWGRYLKGAPRRWPDVAARPRECALRAS